MRLVGAVDGESRHLGHRLADGRMSRRDDGGDCRGRSSAGEEPASSRRHSHPASKPLEDRELDFVGPRCDRPDAREKVEAGREPVTHHRRKCRTARDVSEEAGVRLTSMMRYHAIAKLREHSVKRRWLLRRSSLEQLASRLSIECRKSRLIAKGRQMLRDEVGHLATDALHRRVVEVQ